MSPQQLRYGETFYWAKGISLLMGGCCVRAHVIFHGRVQGVFFRANTKRTAERSGVAGWVRNLLDGTVEAVFEGTKGDVEHVINWCRTQQPYARVTRVDVTWEPPMGLRGFRIRY